MSNLGKIIFLFVPGPIGGAEKVVAFGLKALLKQNINVELWIIKEERVPHVTSAFVALLEAEGLTYKIFSSHGIFDRHLLKGLKKKLAEESPSIIHAHGFKAAFYGRLAKNSNASFVLTHHGKTGHTLKVKIYEFIELQVMKRSQRVIAVSQEMKSMLIRDGIKAENIQVVENFMTTEFKDKSDRRDLKRIKYLFVGRLSPEKGCELLIKSLPPNSDLTIVGDGNERGLLESIAKGLSVHFLGFRKDISQLMSDHDVLVMPSYREGQPLTLIEACCLGMPVLASRVGGIPELIIDGRNGVLFEAGSQIDLMEKFKTMDLKFNELNQRAEELKFEFRKRFSSENWAKTTINIYLKVLSHS